MHAIAVIETGISSKEFWKLNWYDFGLLSLRIKNNRKKEFDRTELTIEMTRSFMTLYHNHNMVMGKSSKPISPQDFWKLSYDQKEDENPEITKQQKLEKLMAFANRAKKRIKNG